MKYKILIFFCLTSMFSFSQYRKNDGNRIGITAGITNTNLYFSNLKFKPGMGWIAGLSVRGNFYNDKWSMIYGMQFSESKCSLNSIAPNGKEESIDYTLSGAQIRILGSYHLVDDFLALDFGPVLQVNGKLAMNDIQNSNLINEHGLLAQDILDISKVNANLYLGVSGGCKRLRANLFYQFGLTNIMGNLNDNEEIKNKNQSSSFNAHMGMISGQLTFNL